MVTVRNAEMADYEEVEHLEELVFQFHQQSRPDYFQPPAKYSYTKEDFAEFLALPCPIALVAVCDGSIAALCFGKITQTTENAFCKARKIALIEDLITLPEYRRQGIASNLMKEAHKIATAKNAESLELCVWNFNPDAVEFYKNFGMQVQFYRMEKKL